MKKYPVVFVMLLAILLQACENNETALPPVDTTKYAHTDMTAQEREKLIAAAAHNKKMIIGKWDLIAADSDLVTFSKKQLSHIIFEKFEFLNDTVFKMYTPTTVEPGTYEWMAENREIVLTSKQGTGRMLIKQADPTTLITKSGDIRFIFKKE